MRRDTIESVASARPLQPRGRGRPTKFTPETRALVTKLLQEGCTRKMAAKIAGIGYSTFMKWLQSSGLEYMEFRQACEASEAAFQREQIRGILDSKDWKAKAWVLERMFPDEFGKRDKLAVQHSVNVSMAKLREMSTDELEARLLQLTTLPAPEDAAMDDKGTGDP